MHCGAFKRDCNAHALLVRVFQSVRSTAWAAKDEKPAAAVAAPAKKHHAAHVNTTKVCLVLRQPLVLVCHAHNPLAHRTKCTM